MFLGTFVFIVVLVEAEFPVVGGVSPAQADEEKCKAIKLSEIKYNKKKYKNLRILGIFAQFCLSSCPEVGQNRLMPIQST